MNSNIGFNSNAGANNNFNSVIRFRDNPIMLNQNDVKQDQNGFYNIIEIEFGRDVTISSDSLMAFSKGTIFYSWPNIDPYYQNNVFKYRWTDNNIYTVTMEKGFYTVDQINAALQATMLANGHYTTSNGTNTFYFSISTLEQFQLLQFTSTLPAGATTVPTIIIPNLAVSELLGLGIAEYPSQGTTASTTFRSAFVPQLQPQTSVFLTCDQLLSSEFTPPGRESIFYNFTPDVTPASQINLEQIDSLWVPMKQQTWNKFTFRLVDQEMRPLNNIDPTMVLTIIVRQRIR